jgi:amino acid transporter
MKKHSSRESSGSLKRVLGFPSLFAVAIGAVASQSSFVSLLNGTGAGAGGFFLCLMIAFILALCYCFSFLELSLMMPRAGGLGTYTSVAAGHFISIGVTLGGYVAVVPFASLAELTLLERIVDMVYPGTFSHLGLSLLILFTVLNLLGIDIFSSVQNVIVYVLLVSLLVIGFTGLYGRGTGGMGYADIRRSFEGSGTAVMSLVVLATWSFTGLEYLCPFIEEARNPKKNLPRTMLLAAVALMVVFALLSLAALRYVPAEKLAGSEVPHWLMVESIFGKTAGFVMVVFAVTATSCVTNTAIASVPRMLYGMAQHNQLPAIFGRLHPRWKTPWFGILFLSALVVIPLILLAGAKDLILTLLISAATFWLVAYIVAHLTVMVLRKKFPFRHRPFETPFYPLPQVIGIIGMGYAIWDNSPSAAISKQVYINSACLFIGISIYAYLWVKYSMKKGLLEAEPWDEAYED